MPLPKFFHRRSSQTGKKEISSKTENKTQNNVLTGQGVPEDKCSAVREGNEIKTDAAITKIENYTEIKKDCEDAVAQESDNREPIEEDECQLSASSFKEASCLNEDKSEVNGVLPQLNQSISDSIKERECFKESNEEKEILPVAKNCDQEKDRGVSCKVGNPNLPESNLCKDKSSDPEYHENILENEYYHAEEDARHEQSSDKAEPSEETSLCENDFKGTNLEDCGSINEKINDECLNKSFESNGESKSMHSDACENGRELRKETRSASEIVKGAETAHVKDKRSESESTVSSIQKHSQQFDKKDIENIVTLYIHKLIKEAVVTTLKIEELESFCGEIIDKYSQLRDTDKVENLLESLKADTALKQRIDAFGELGSTTIEIQQDDPINVIDGSESNREGPKTSDSTPCISLDDSGDERIREDQMDSDQALSDLIVMSSEDPLTCEADSRMDIEDPLPKHCISEDEKKSTWKVGYLNVKLPHKSRGKGNLKVWKKRCVSIQPDEFVNDPQYPCLMISVYSAESGTSRRHNALFWKAVSCQKAVVYRSHSRSHRYVFTVADDNQAVVHLAADTETDSQEWMAAMRAILWPPSPVMQLEKMLSGSEFEIAIIDNDFSFHAGLLGMYGYLSITPKKLILLHPQMGYVIQEWYLNTIDKFQLMPQSKPEDAHKVLSMTTCSDSSTGRGEILMFCNEAVAMLHSIASTIHRLLKFHSKHDASKYKKEMEELASWLNENDEHYKVPPKQIKSLLDVPNFIFEKPVAPLVNAKPLLKPSQTCVSTFSHDSGISMGEDFLNCSVTSFAVGAGIRHLGKSSDSEESSDAYTPPRTPDENRKRQQVPSA